MIRKTFRFINILRRRSMEDNTPALSSQLTYYLLLSFFPFVMFLLTLLSYTPLTEQEVMLRIGDIFPENIRTIVLSIISEIANNQSDALLSITVIITLWSASRGVLAIVNALNIAYDLDETRSFLHLRLTSLFYTLIFAVIIVLTFIFLIFGNHLLSLASHYIDLADGLKNLVQWIRYLVSIGLLFLFFILLYNAIPNRKVSFKEVVPGAIFSSIGWILISIFFSFYIDNFSNYSYMYGSLAGIVILLLWLYICSNIIMIGGEINALLVDLREGNEDPIYHQNRRIQQKKNKVLKN